MRWQASSGLGREDLRYSIRGLGDEAVAATARTLHNVVSARLSGVDWTVDAAVWHGQFGPTVPWRFYLSATEYGRASVTVMEAMADLLVKRDLMLEDSFAAQTGDEALLWINRSLTKSMVANWGAAIDRHGEWRRGR
jgi:hypothetical protein